MITKTMTPRTKNIFHQAGLLLPMDPPPPARELSYGPAPAGGRQQLVLVESAPSSLPLGLVQPHTSMQTSSPLPSNLLPNKKRRLLTFLSEQTDPGQITGKETHVHMESTPMSLYSSLPSYSEPESMVLAPPTLTTLVPLAKSTTDSVPPQPATLIINPHQPAQSKAESTLIINSAGTAATLFTPATAFTPAKACTVPVSDSLQLGLSSSPVLAPTKQWASLSSASSVRCVVSFVCPAPV